MSFKSTRSVSTMSIAQQRSILLGLLATISACVPKYSSDGDGASGRGANSRLSQIQMSLPSSDSLVTADGKKPVNALRVSIEPVDTSCPNATKLDQILPITNASSLQQKIRKGCDYDLRVELGQTDSGTPSSTALKVIYYAPSAATRITADMTKTDKISAQVWLQLTDTGQKIGLPATLSSQQPQQPQQPEPPQPPQPSPTNIPDKINVNLTGSSGVVKLADVFTSDYLVVDFSRPGCPPCVSLARQLEGDTRFQEMVSGKKCRTATILPKGQLSDWIDTLGGANTHTAKTSFEYSESHSGFARLFEFTLKATPTFLIVDRKGAIVDQAVGSTPAKLKTLCGG